MLISLIAYFIPGLLQQQTWLNFLNGFVGQAFQARILISLEVFNCLTHCIKWLFMIVIKLVHHSESDGGIQIYRQVTTNQKLTHQVQLRCWANTLPSKNINVLPSCQNADLKQSINISFNLSPICVKHTFSTAGIWFIYTDYRAHICIIWRRHF